MGLVLLHFQKPPKNTPHKTPTLFRSSEGRIHSTFFGHPVEYWTEGYVPCIGVKIPSQVDFDLAMTSLRGESDKGDKSESGLQPEGGDNRCKGIMILLRSHRPSVESGLKSAREPSHPMSAAGQKATGRGTCNPSHDLVTAMREP